MKKNKLTVIFSLALLLLASMFTLNAAIDYQGQENMENKIKGNWVRLKAYELMMEKAESTAQAEQKQKYKEIDTEAIKAMVQVREAIKSSNLDQADKIKLQMNLAHAIKDQADMIKAQMENSQIIDKGENEILNNITKLKDEIISELKNYKRPAEGSSPIGQKQ